MVKGYNEYAWIMIFKGAGKDGTFFICFKRAIIYILTLKNKKLVWVALIPKRLYNLSVE